MESQRATAIVKRLSDRAKVNGVIAQTAPELPSFVKTFRKEMTVEDWQRVEKKIDENNERLSRLQLDIATFRPTINKIELLDNEFRARCDVTNQRIGKLEIDVAAIHAVEQAKSAYQALNVNKIAIIATVIATILSAVIASAITVAFAS